MFLASAAAVPLSARRLRVSGSASWDGVLRLSSKLEVVAAAKSFGLEGLLARAVLPQPDYLAAGLQKSSQTYLKFWLCARI
jgi:hypothetical protein